MDAIFLILAIASIAYAFYTHSVSGKALRRESESLRRNTKVIIDGLEAAKIITVARDENGNPTGIKVIARPGAATIKVEGGQPTVGVSSDES